MNIYWKNAINGSFTDPNNWVQGVVPGAGDIAELTSTANVSATSAVTVLGVNIGALSELVIESGFTATEGTPMGAADLGGIVVNGGTFSVGGTLNDTDGPTSIEVHTATLAVDGFDLTVKGGGRVILDPGSSIFVAAGKTLSNVDNLIIGTGIISGAGTFVNHGDVDTLFNGNQIVIDIATRNQGRIEAFAVTGSSTLQINGSVINNTGGGIIQASGSSSVGISGSVINNTSGGVIRAEDSSSVVGIGSDTSIIGGSVTAGAFGKILVSGTNVTFDGGKSVVPTNTSITVNGEVELSSGTVLNLRGTINNGGNIAALGSATVVVQPSGTNSTVTLKGSGTVGLNGDQITGGGSAVTLDNVNNTIVGGGKIGGAGLKLKNEIGGTIDAFDTLIIDTGANAITNAGALNAEAATLVIASNLSNTGKLNADDGMIYVGGKATGGTATVGLGSGAALEFGAAASTATKFAAGTTGQLILADSAQYSGVISGFGSNTTQSIDLADFNFTGAQKISFSLGVLTLKNTAGQVVHLHFSGAHTLASFILSDDGNFNGTDDGTKIVDPPATTKPQTPPSNPLASLFGQFMASWNPVTALSSEVHSPLASELQIATNLLLAHR